MTAAEKKELAGFLDTAFDALHGGYRCEKQNTVFTDDPILDSLAKPCGPESIEAIAREIYKCTACRLCKIRAQAVPGEGADRPDVMVIDSGPGQEEDVSGRPFTGISGERLDKMLTPIGLLRNTNCFFTGIIKCRTPEGREPLPEETISCASFLQRQIALLNPKIILCLGRIAAQSLLRTNEELDTLRERGSKIRIADKVIPVIASYHPDDIWANEELKRPAWEDLKKLKAWLEANSKDSPEEQ